MANAIVDRKLEQSVIPYIISGRKLKRQWFYMTNTLFGYTTDLLGAATSIGLAVPRTLAFFMDKPADATNAGVTVGVFDGLRPELYYPALAVALLWVILRVMFARENGQKKAVLARSAATTMRQAEASLYKLLASPDPLPGLNELLNKQLEPTVDRAIQEEAWPWTPFAPNIDAEVKRFTDQLTVRFGEDWIPPPPLSEPQQMPKP